MQKIGVEDIASFFLIEEYRIEKLSFYTFMFAGIKGERLRFNN